MLFDLIFVQSICWSDFFYFYFCSISLLIWFLFNSLIQIVFPCFSFHFSFERFNVCWYALTSHSPLPKSNLYFWFLSTLFFAHWILLIQLVLDFKFLFFFSCKDPILIFSFLYFFFFQRFNFYRCNLNSLPNHFISFTLLSLQRTNLSNQLGAFSIFFLYFCPGCNLYLSSDWYFLGRMSDEFEWFRNYRRIS